MKKTLLVLSHFNFQSGGYMHICREICKILADDFNIIILGDQYRGQYHQFPFSIVPSRFEMWPAQISGILDYERVKTILVFHDLPKHEKLLRAFEDRLSDKKLRYIGVFPIESGPLLPTWANAIEKMDWAFVLSKFGLEECNKSSLTDVTYLPAGIDTDFWQPGDKGEARKKHRLDADIPIVITVADNQERKNLQGGFKTIALLKEKLPDVLWILVTVPRDTGWDLGTLADLYDLRKNTAILHNIGDDVLLDFYRGADVLFLPSLADGLGMPLLEANAVGLPTVGTDCTAITESVDYPVPHRFKHLDCYGTSWRYWIDEEKAAQILQEAIECPKFSKRKTRSWTEAANLVSSRV